MPELAGQVAPVGHLDFQHFGAQQRELEGRVGAGEDIRQVDDAQAGEQAFCHS